MTQEMTTVDRVRRLAEPVATGLDLDVYDVEMRSGTLRITLDARPGASGGLTLDVLALASRLIARDLDFEDPVPGRYTLEVTSPGLERPLRTPDHFRRAIGSLVAVRLRDTAGDERRVRGTLVDADDSGLVVLPDGAAADAPRRIEYEHVDRARTVFEWGPAERPTSPSRGRPRSTSRAARHSPPDPKGTP